MRERFEILGLEQAIGPDNFYPSVRTAVDGCVGAMSAESDPIHEDS
jgi:hypothetical protein